jgi:hypothetical protein
MRVPHTFKLCINKQNKKQNKNKTKNKTKTKQKTKKKKKKQKPKNKVPPWRVLPSDDIAGRGRVERARVQERERVPRRPKRGVRSSWLIVDKKAS